MGSQNSFVHYIDLNKSTSYTEIYGICANFMKINEFHDIPNTFVASSMNFDVFIEFVKTDMSDKLHEGKEP